MQKIKLGGDLGLRNADTVREQILDALGNPRGLRVDATELTAIDMSVVQVLIAAQKLAKDRNRDFQIQATADGPLQQAMSRAGLIGASATSLDISWQTRDRAS